MKSKTRIAGIIIQDGKLLMLKGQGFKELWTPCGKIEEGESDEKCLKRELQEEIKVDLVESKFFGEYTGHSFYQPEIPLIQRIYLVTINGKIKPAAEIEGFIWFSKEDFETKKYPLITVTEKQIIPDLIKTGIW